MTRVLLDRVKIDLRLAKYSMNDPDELILQGAPYHIQQAIEKCLKQVYIECGKDYRRTHEINSLLHGLPTWQPFISRDLCEQIEDVSDTLSKWEHISRYEDTYLATRRKITALYTLAENVYEQVLKSIGEVDKAAEVAASKEVGKSAGQIGKLTLP